MQFDEKWEFVYKKQRHCDDGDPLDRRCGDQWDHVALDPEHRLVIDVVCGKRTAKRVRQLVKAAHQRTGRRLPRLITTDEYRPYKQAILEAWGKAMPREWPFRPGQPRRTKYRPPDGLVYATVHKTRRKGRVVKVEARLVYGTEEDLAAALAASPVSKAVNTAFIERQNGTDRHRNSRKVRKTYRFSKELSLHEASTYFTMYSYNFCWPVRTLREEIARGHYRPRTPAMVARLSDHVWTLSEWLRYPVKPE